MPEVVLTGAAGRIEGRYSQGKTENAPVALILHPHPKAGGQMNNPVAVQLFHLFMKRGFSVLRFNFRGVGRSQGEFDGGIGELADAATALDWLQTTNPAASQCWVAGYSFGAWVGMQLLMRRPETDGFISVSPPTNAYDFSFLAPCPASGLILHGQSDTVVPPIDVERVVSKLRTQKGIVIDYDVVEGASHFWMENLPDVEQRVGAYLDRRLEARPGPAGVLAVVTAPEDAVRARRKLTNRLIAAHEAARLRPFFSPDVKLIVGDGALILGVDDVIAAFAAQFAEPGFGAYVRETGSVELDAAGARAAEHGRWTGTWADRTMGGTYLAVWRRVTGQWMIESELYVTLRT